MPSQQCFKKIERISCDREIKTIRSRGESFTIYPFKIYRYPNKILSPRLAIAITRKAGPSVLRHHAARKIREFFRRHKKILGSFDYYFFSSVNLTGMTKNEWKNIINRIISCFEKQTKVSTE